MLRRTSRSAACLLALSGLLAGVAGASTSAAPSQDFTLDMYKSVKPNQGSVDVSSPEVLTTNKWYIAQVRGTVSFVKPSMWTRPHLTNGKPLVVCGTPEASPLLNSAGAETGRVGVDPEVMFAQVMRAKLCKDDKTPRTTRLFEVRPKNIWRHPTPLDGRHWIARADHTYSYAIKGLGAKAQFRQLDRPTNDNYGSFHITLRPATTADCAGTRWKNFDNENGRSAFANGIACAYRISLSS
jgi:hypothetical protein